MLARALSRRTRTVAEPPSIPALDWPSLILGRPHERELWLGLTVVHSPVGLTIVDSRGWVERTTSILEVGLLSSILEVDSPSFIPGVDSPSFNLEVDSPSVAVVCGMSFVEICPAETRGSLLLESLSHRRVGRLPGVNYFSPPRLPLPPPRRTPPRLHPTAPRQAPPAVCQEPLLLLSRPKSPTHRKHFSPFIAPTPAWLRGDNKRIELTRPNRDGAYQPHRD